MPFSIALRPHQRKEDDVADGGGRGKEHDEAIDADADAGRGRHSLADRFDEIFIHLPGFFVRSRLFDEEAPLQLGVIQLGVGVAELFSENKTLEPLDKALFRISGSRWGLQRGVVSIGWSMIWCGWIRWDSTFSSKSIAMRLPRGAALTAAGSAGVSFKRTARREASSIFRHRAGRIF